MPNEELPHPEPAPEPASPARRRFVKLAAAGLASTWLVARDATAQAAQSISASSASATPANASANPNTNSGANSNAAAGTTTTSRVARASVSNRAPLQKVPFYALPLGSVQARGWLLQQLELQRDGLTGHAEEILPAAMESAWKGEKGEDWEKGPYYLKGLVPLAYTLDDANMKARVVAWIEPILASQREDGFFGPKNDDWWPRMVANYLLRDYQEATNDERVVPFLSKYFRFMAANVEKRPLREWSRARAGDEIDTIFWLYNRTGEEFLLALADTLNKQAYPWTDIFSNNRFLEFGEDFHPKHNVNVPQAMKMPPVYWQRSNSPQDRAAFSQGDEHLMRDHGLAVGINSGTEFLSGRSTMQGIETCSTVERMLSDETAMRILGEASIGDNLEMLAFNALPAAVSKSFRQHVYYTLPNNVSAPRSRMGYTQDYDNGRTPSPISGFPCCCYNLHMGWPKLAQNSWAATSDGGLAVMAYVPSQVLAEVAGGTPVSIVAETSYPFEETIRLQLDTPRSVRFGLSLRIPAWCPNASISVNGKSQPRPQAGTFAVIEREWKAGDEVVLRFPMAVRTVPGVNGSVSVRRGPLVYTLAIDEEWKAFDKNKVEGFESFEVTPNSPWNYGLVVDERDPGSSFSRQRRATSTASTYSANPFDKEHTPLALQVRARRVSDWTLAWNRASAFDPPTSPVPSLSPIETVSLVPFGAQMLRVTNFPVIGPSRRAPKTFSDRFENDHFDNWVLYGGGWLVRDGAFGPSPDAPTSKAVASATRFGDFVYEADVSLNEAGNAGLLFRLSRPAIGADAHSGYYIGLSAADGRIQLGKSNNNWSALQTVEKTLAANQPHHIRVEARGPQIRIFVNDMAQPVIEAMDYSFAEGAIGLRQYGAKTDKPGATFRNITVSAL